ncbi:gloB [Symbiodinium natans]|uniref:GloB protein n=1 Tax=Symbiodinium natans TaxID=878477 RepID=A0A812M8R3_9DINO|nr:gloB [Symbiodinium natans]
MARGGGECLVQNPHGQEASLVQNIFRVSKHAGPLTDGITPEDFSHVLVPIGASILVPALCCTCLIFLHELHVGAGAKPWLASHDQNSTVLLQVAFLTFWFVPYLIDSMMIPLSLEYALAMGESATASGVFLGMAAAGSTVGIVLGQSLTSEADWNQRYARKLFIYFYGLSVMTMPLLALILQASIDWSLRARRLTFWLVIALNFVNTCIGSIPIIAWSTMWNIVTPQGEKTFWMMLTQCARNAGFILGSIYLAGLSHAIRLAKGGQTTSPINMMSWAFMASFFIQLLELAAYSLIFPTELKDASPPQVESPSSEVQEVSEIRPEDLEDAAKEQVVWGVIFYGYERTFSVGAIEVATIMLLEVSYGWPPERSGVSFVVIAAGSIVLTGLSTLAVSMKLTTESLIYLLMTYLGLGGSVLLFDFHVFGAGSLLVADALVYGGASVANGIAEGWACRAATMGTSYSIETYRAHSTAGVNVSRFLAPIIARFLLDFGGRNLYAAVQFLFAQVSEKEIRVPTSGGLLISGDTLFVGGAGRTDLVESNHQDMLQSLERLCKLPSDTVVLPGHNYDPLAFTTIDMEGGGNSVIANAKAFFYSWEREAGYLGNAGFIYGATIPSVYLPKAINDFPEG